MQRLGVVVHVCSPRYLGIGQKEQEVSGQLQQRQQLDPGSKEEENKNLSRSPGHSGFTVKVDIHSEGGAEGGRRTETAYPELVRSTMQNLHWDSPAASGARAVSVASNPLDSFST